MESKQNHIFHLSGFQHRNRHSHSHHHYDHQLDLQHRHNNNSNVHTKNQMDFYYGLKSRVSNTQNKIQTYRATASNTSANNNVLSITSSAHTKSLTNPLKLTLIQANGNSFVANNYPNTINRHFYRWPIATQSTSSTKHSSHTEYDIKWKADNNNNNNYNPFASNHNPTIETTSTIPTKLPSTNNIYRTFIDHQVHSKHHTGYGYVNICILHITIMIIDFD